MASLNGITIANLNKFDGMEGTSYQGDICLGDKKIGFWSEDGNGGPAWFEFVEGYSFDKFDELCKETHEPHKYYDGSDMPYDAELFMYDLLCLTLDEKKFIRFKKQGFELVIKAGTQHLGDALYAYHGWPVDKAIKDVFEKNKKGLERVSQFGEKLEYRVYESLDDFIIGKPYDEKDMIA